MGRPREFCLQGALDKALEVFWRRGFDGASLTELTAAMGITRPSLYAAYGNKEQLFHKALDLYDRKHMGFMREALDVATSRDAAAKILHGMVRATATDGVHPAGCMSMNGALACSAAADPIKEETARRRRVFAAELAQRFLRDKVEGNLPAWSDADALADFLMTMAMGIACQAASGAPSDVLHAAADMALGAWPAARTEALDTPA